MHTKPNLTISGKLRGYIYDGVEGIQDSQLSLKMTQIFQLEGIDDHPYDVEYDNAKYGPRVKSALKLAYPFPKGENNFQMTPNTKERYIHSPFLIDDANSNELETFRV